MSGSEKSIIAEIVEREERNVGSFTRMEKAALHAYGLAVAKAVVEECAVTAYDSPSTLTAATRIRRLAAPSTGKEER